MNTIDINTNLYLDNNKKNQDKLITYFKKEHMDTSYIFILKKYKDLLNNENSKIDKKELKAFKDILLLNEVGKIDYLDTFKSNKIFTYSSVLKQVTHYYETGRKSKLEDLTNLKKSFEPEERKSYYNIKSLQILTHFCEKDDELINYTIDKLYNGAINKYNEYNKDTTKNYDKDNIIEDPLDIISILANSENKEYLSKYNQEDLNEINNYLLEMGQEILNNSDNEIQNLNNDKSDEIEKLTDYDLI